MAIHNPTPDERERAKETVAAACTLISDTAIKVRQALGTGAAVSGTAGVLAASVAYAVGEMKPGRFANMDEFRTFQTHATHKLWATVTALLEAEGLSGLVIASPIDPKRN